MLVRHFQFLSQLCGARVNLPPNMTPSTNWLGRNLLKVVMWVQISLTLLYGKFSKNGVAPRDGENIKITFDGFK